MIVGSGAGLQLPALRAQSSHSKGACFLAAHGFCNLSREGDDRVTPTRTREKRSANELTRDSSKCESLRMFHTETFCCYTGLGIIPSFLAIMQACCKQAQESLKLRAMQKRSYNCMNGPSCGSTEGMMAHVLMFFWRDACHHRLCLPTGQCSP